MTNRNRLVIRNFGVLSILLLGICGEVYAQAPQTAPAPLAPAADKGGAAPPAEPILGAPKATGPTGTSATVLDTSAIQGLMGRSVKSYVGEDLGLIVDCLVTPGGQARAVVIDFGGVLGVGSRKVAVDWKALDFAGTAKGAAVVLALTRNEVRVSPEYKVGDPVVVLESTQPGASNTAVSASPAPHPPQAAPGPPPADPKKN